MSDDQATITITTVPGRGEICPGRQGGAMPYTLKVMVFGSERESEFVTIEGALKYAHEGEDDDAFAAKAILHDGAEIISETDLSNALHERRTGRAPSVATSTLEQERHDAEAQRHQDALSATLPEGARVCCHADVTVIETFDQYGNWVHRETRCQACPQRGMDATPDTRVVMAPYYSYAAV